MNNLSVITNDEVKAKHFHKRNSNSREQHLHFTGRTIGMQFTCMSICAIDMQFTCRSVCDGACECPAVLQLNHDHRTNPISV